MEVEMLQRSLYILSLPGPRGRGRRAQSGSARVTLSTQQRGEKWSKLTSSHSLFCLAEVFSYKCTYEFEGLMCNVRLYANKAGCWSSRHKHSPGDVECGCKPFIWQFIIQPSIWWTGTHLQPKEDTFDILLYIIHFTSNAKHGVKGVNCHFIQIWVKYNQEFGLKVDIWAKCGSN